MKLPSWSRPERPDPGKRGFTSIPGEAALAKRFPGGSRRAMSGAGNLPFDVATRDWLIDSKETSAKSYSVNRGLMNKLTERAIKEGRRPMMTVTFWNDGVREESWAIVRLDDLPGQE